MASFLKMLGYLGNENSSSYHLLSFFLVFKCFHLVLLPYRYAFYFLRMNYLINCHRIDTPTSTAVFGIPISQFFQKSIIYSNLCWPVKFTSESPPATIPPAMMVTPYRPDLVVHNTSTNSIALLELTCPLDSEHHLESARERKQNKVEYLQLLAELYHLNICNFYETLEVSHYHRFCVKNLWSFSHFILQDIPVSKSVLRQTLDDASQLCYSFVKDILAWDCHKWFPSPDWLFSFCNVHVCMLI